MPLDFDVRRPTRRCAVGDRPLAPGEPYVSVLVDDGTEVLRRDVAASVWVGPPEEAVGWWRTRMPGGDGKPQAAPREVLLGLLDQWADDPAEASARYVLALLLVRRRVLRIETGGFAAGLAGGTNEAPTQTLRLSCAERDDPILVAIVSPTTDETAAIEARLAELLGITRRKRRSLEYFLSRTLHG